MWRQRGTGFGEATTCGGESLGLPTTLPKTMHRTRATTIELSIATSSAQSLPRLRGSMDSDSFGPVNIGYLFGYGFFPALEGLKRFA